MKNNRTLASMGRWILLSAVLLLTSLHPLQAEASQVPDFVKVGLRYGNTAVSQCTITSPNGFSVGSVSDRGGFSETLPLPGYTELTAIVVGNHVELRDREGVLISADIGANGGLVPYDAEDGFLSLDGRKYRGGILLKVNSGKTLNVINYLTMDEYLYGVVHREMSSSNPLEALKAQAVAARTFVAGNRDRHVSDGFDVCATTHCQVYGGLSDEYANTNRAVDETSGAIIRYQNGPAEVYYHKNSGGHTQNSEDEWYTRTPYLRGVEDPYSPEYPWQATLTFDTLRQKLAQGQLDPGAIESVRIGGRDASGAVSSLVIKGSEREVNLSRSMIRATLGSSLVRSRHFSLGTSYEGGDPSPGGTSLALLSGSGKKTVTGSDTVYVLPADGNAEKSGLASISMTNGNTTVKAAGSGGGSGSFDDSGVITGGPLALSGLGYGHGVGMSQDGAIEMAKQGKNYIEILKFYFTGIEVN